MISEDSDASIARNGWRWSISWKTSKNGAAVHCQRLSKWHCTWSV